MMANFVVMGCTMPFVYRPMPALDLGGFATIAVLGFMGALFHIAAYRTARAVVVAPMQYSQMLWAILLGAVIFGETPDFWTISGAGIIMCSGIYIVLREGRSNASANQPVLHARNRAEIGAYPRAGALMNWRRRQNGKKS